MSLTLGRVGAVRATHGPLRERERWRPLELFFWAACVLAFFVVPDSLLLLTQALIGGLLAMSLDVLLGYAGIASLGHAAFFGLGAYASALAMLHGWTEPVSNLLVGATVAGVAGLAVGMIVSRLSSIALLVVTLGIGLLLYEGVTQFPGISGGEDGLRGLAPAPLLGRFEWDLAGQAGYIYVVAVVATMYWLARRLVMSPFGLTLQAMRENAARLPALGVPRRRTIAVAFMISATLAGVAGALSMQISEFVGMNVLSLERSFSVLIMLALGGTGTLVGGMIGGAVFVIASDQLATMSPVYWNFWLGLMLVGIVVSGAGGVTGSLSRAGRLLRRITTPRP